MTRTIILTCAVIICLVACMQELPPAMQYETDHQRAIAAGQYHHIPGAGDYQQVVEANP